MTDGNQELLSEQYVQDCFHSYLKSSLTQAKIEKLLATDVLASAEGDLMITGPALCLYFAALRSTTNPPSVPLPRLNKLASSLPPDLSLSNCPPTFRPFLIVWSHLVPEIQSLTPELQHDLARIICNLPPLVRGTTNSDSRLNGIAADLRAVAIEISMRRTFQDRYAGDLQAAIDAGTPGGAGRSGNGNGSGRSGNGSGEKLKIKASFVPPPTYEAEPTSPPYSAKTAPFPGGNGSGPNPIPSPVPPSPPTKGSGLGSSRTRYYMNPIPPSPSGPATSASPPFPSSPSRSPALGPTHGPPSLAPISPLRISKHPKSPQSSSPPSTHTHSLSPSPSSPSPPSRSQSRASSISRSGSGSGKTILVDDSPAIELIRETLYAALADVLEKRPWLRKMLKADPGRAYFASVALAILDVASYSTFRIRIEGRHHHHHGEHGYGERRREKEEEEADELAIRGVLGQPLTLSTCPPELRPFMKELCDIGEKVKEMEEEDSLDVVKALQRGQEVVFDVGGGGEKGSTKTNGSNRLERVRAILEGGVGWVYNGDVVGRKASERNLQKERSRSRSPQPPPFPVHPSRQTETVTNGRKGYGDELTPDGHHGHHHHHDHSNHHYRITNPDLPPPPLPPKDDFYATHLSMPDPRRRTTSIENRAVAFANRINGLALGMMGLRAFRERQDMVFKVLVGVGEMGGGGGYYGVGRRGEKEEEEERWVGGFI